jgi:hypothetical protein
MIVLGTFCHLLPLPGKYVIGRLLHLFIQVAVTFRRTTFFDLLIFDKKCAVFLASSIDNGLSTC